MKWKKCYGYLRTPVPSDKNDLRSLVELFRHDLKQGSQAHRKVSRTQAIDFMKTCPGVK